jgi:hypothetical protein
MAELVSVTHDLAAASAPSLRGGETYKHPMTSPPSRIE